MLDRYVYGRVERISPEAPVPIHLKEKESSDIGGAGTVLRNLSDLGAYVYFFSVVGDDDAGHEITRLVGNIPNVEANIIVEVGRPTTVKTRFVCGHHQLARADEETCRLIASKTIKEMNSAIFFAMEKCDAVIVSDYAKGTVTGRKSDNMKHWGAWSIIFAAKNKRIPCIVDPKSDDFSLYTHATVITPNIPELNKATRSECYETDEIISAAGDIIDQHQIENVLVTRSKDGMTLITNDNLIHNIPSTAKEVYDVTGAGDTAVAVLALGMASGLPLVESCRIANAAAGIVVGKLGTATVSPQELEDII